MRNTKAIIEAICNHTTFSKDIKSGLTYLKESNVDIIYWKHLNSKEEDMLLESSVTEYNPENIRNAFGRFTSGISGDLAKEKAPQSNSDWSANTLMKLNISEPSKPKSQQDLEAHKADREKYMDNQYRDLDRKGMTQDERIKQDIASAKDSYYNAVMQTERNIGKTNIKTYIEKISDDVQNFVSLVTYLTDQIIKEAWIKSPERIQSIFGKELYFLESPALAIRGSNIKGFMQESSNVLQLATDVSSYFVLDNANKEIKKSVEEVWPDVLKLSKEKLEKTPIPAPVKTVFAFNETISEDYLSALVDALWESIPAIIEKHGDEFFLILEQQAVVPQFDAFKSNQFQSYHPIFETMYNELREKKPFNWLLKLESQLIDDKEIEKNLELCTQAMVQEQLSSIRGYTYPSIGKIAGFTAHQLVQKAYNDQNGLGDFLGVKESLWITSGYVPGTFGLILLLFNVSCAVLFVATAEDIVGFDMSKSYPQFTGLPIWEAYKNGAMDLKAKYEEQRKNKIETIEKEGIASPRDAKKTGIKFN